MAAVASRPVRMVGDCVASLTLKTIWEYLRKKEANKKHFPTVVQLLLKYQ